MKIIPQRGYEQVFLTKKPFLIDWFYNWIPVFFVQIIPVQNTMIIKVNMNFLSTREVSKTVHKTPNLQLKKSHSVEKLDCL